uniref:Uncharacterized protein n=1 Tax=Meleagris gallopavo TaxID=9103 RepID=A0A803YQ53_MELGA
MYADRVKSLNMPRSPTSSEDEMAQSYSDYSVESESDSSKEETIYDTIRATAEKPSSRMDDSQSNTLVIRIIIPDLQQTVRDITLSFKRSLERLTLLFSIHSKSVLFFLQLSQNVFLFAFVSNRCVQLIA